MKAQLNLFTSFNVFNTAQKEVVYYTKKRFPNLSLMEIEEIVSDAFLVTHRFHEMGKLTIPPVAFCKVIACRKATDATRKQATLHKQGISFVDADFAREIPVYTEGGLAQDCYDDNWAFLLNQTNDCISKQSYEMQCVFQADNDSVLSKLSDVAIAQYYNFKTQTATSVRKKRCDMKKRVTVQLASTPQYQRLQVVYQRRQVA